jgi:hypothetical protein
MLPVADKDKEFFSVGKFAAKGVIRGYGNF